MKRILLITIIPTIKVQILRSLALQKALPTIKFPKNHITSSYYSKMPKIAKAKIWPLRTLGVKVEAPFKTLNHFCTL
jgi:hypothetical protein